MYITLIGNNVNTLVYSWKNGNLKCLYFVCFLIWSDCIWYQRNCDVLQLISQLYYGCSLIKIYNSNWYAVNVIFPTWSDHLDFFFRSSNFVLFDLFRKPLPVREDRACTRFSDKFSTFRCFMFYIIQVFMRERGLERIWSWVSLKLRREREVVICRINTIIDRLWCFSCPFHCEWRKCFTHDFSHLGSWEKNLL